MSTPMISDMEAIIASSDTKEGLKAQLCRSYKLQENGRLALEIVLAVDEQELIYSRSVKKELEELTFMSVLMLCAYRERPTKQLLLDEGRGFEVTFDQESNDHKVLWAYAVKYAKEISATEMHLINLFFDQENTIFRVMIA